MRLECVTACLALLWISTASAETGDPHSFGRPMKWRGGFLQGSSVMLREDCSRAPAGQRCLQLQPAPATTEFDEHDLGTIVLPANSARSLLCQVVIPHVEYVIANPDPLGNYASVWAVARLRVENAVLADPNLINPVTGQPFGGFFEDTLPGGHQRYKNLDGFEAESVYEADGSRFCVNAVISKTRLIDFYGLTAAQATAFFASEITLRLSIRGSARLVDDVALFRFNVRFLSD